MKYLNKNLLDICHQVELSSLKASTMCFAAEFHGTKEYAKQQVSFDRAKMKDIKQSIDYILKKIEEADSEVEKRFSEMQRKGI